jgi:hypothetical protein
MMAAKPQLTDVAVSLVVRKTQWFQGRRKRDFFVELQQRKVVVESLPVPVWVEQHPGVDLMNKFRPSYFLDFI